jgi:hypothetical protein
MLAQGIYVGIGIGCLFRAVCSNHATILQETKSTGQRNYSDGQ